ncbi:hypothetical protein [Mucilaginibacter antarcticus]|uniref:Uncharacterized protein n=1 Tax=Mucilaginibacter antarcticus TaxID=1855725 RepID=A0ABW5XK92_9SPHI
MEKKYSLLITVITVCLIVLTAAVIGTMDTNATRNIYEGLLLLSCIILFTGSLIARGSFTKA